MLLDVTLRADLSFVGVAIPDSRKEMMRFESDFCNADKDIGFRPGGSAPECFFAPHVFWAPCVLDFCPVLEVVPQTIAYNLDVVAGTAVVVGRLNMKS
jgi:hypothetical protein